jgi:hypothetical protein
MYFPELIVQTPNSTYNTRDTVSQAVSLPAKIRKTFYNKSGKNQNVNHPAVDALEPGLARTVQI